MEGSRERWTKEGEGRVFVEVLVVVIGVFVWDFLGVRLWFRYVGFDGVAF